MRLCGYCQSLCGVFELLTRTISLTLPGDPPPGFYTSTSTNKGVIAGATVAACIAVIVVVGALLWYLRKRRIRSKVLGAEPLPLSATHISARTPQQAPDAPTAASLRHITPTPSHRPSSEVPLKAEYRGNTIPSVVSGSGSSRAVSSSTHGARNIPPTIHSSSRSIPVSPLSAHPDDDPLSLLPPPSYAAAAGDLQIHEDHPNPE
jgi:hypothetical protein